MMHEIDISGWKEFVIGDLFEISRPIARGKDSYADGDVPFVASGCFNNGVVKMVAPHDDEQMDDGNCLTVSPLDGCTFYQHADFLGRGGAGSAIIILRNKNLSLTVGLFIAAVLSETLKAHSYIDQISSASIMSMTIKLPTISSGDPDWEYMDVYMSGILAEERDYADKLTKHDFAKHEIDTSGWKEFKVGELFDTFKPPVLHDRQVTPSENGLPYVVRTKFNNGIKDLVVTGKEVEPSPAGVITWGAENASFFYQEQPFYSGRDIYYLDTRGLNMNTCHFLAAALSTVISKYPYNYGLFPDLLKGETIRLPVTLSGKPDWDYMDLYMTKIMAEEKLVADELTA